MLLTGVVAQSGMSKGARELAAAALSALREKKLLLTAQGQKHVMLSCELLVLWCDVQHIVLVSFVPTATLRVLLCQGGCRLTDAAVAAVVWSRPMECASHDPAAERVADGSVIRDLV